MATSPETFTDNNERTLHRNRVADVALDNIINSMSVEELAIAYLEGLSNDDLLQWATDDAGNFSAYALGEDD